VGGFAKRVRPVCTPGLPYKDSLVYVVFDWRIFSRTSFPDFTRPCRFNIKSYVYSFNVSDLFSHIQTAFNSSKNYVSLETVTLVLTGSDLSVENRLDLVFWRQI
jgi:hypothetical protein